MLEVNAKAPDFTLPDPARKPVSLSDFRGRTVVLAFFPAAFTSVCQAELCAFRDALAAFNDLNAQVLGISVDAPFANGAFAEKNGLTFPVLSDYQRTVVRAYDVAHDDFAGLQGYTAARRSVYVIDGDGVIRYAWGAPNPGVQPDYDAVQRAVASLAPGAQR